MIFRPKYIIEYFFSSILILVIICSCDSKKLAQIPTTKVVSADFNSIYTEILSKNCVQCHEPEGSATVNNFVQLDFSTASSAYQTLTTETSTGVAANTNGQCFGVPLIVKSSPTESYMLATLSTQYNHTNFYKTDCSPYLPDAHGATVSASDLDAIVKWIQDGALNN